MIKLFQIILLGFVFLGKTYAIDVTEGEYFTIKGKAENLTPKLFSKCNEISNTTSNCVAVSNSVFFVENIKSGKATIIFTYTPKINDQYYGCEDAFWSWNDHHDSVYCKEILPKLKPSTSSYVTEGILYEVALTELNKNVKKYKQTVFFDLKAVLVPQKIYQNDLSHSSNPTFGVAFSLGNDFTSNGFTKVKSSFDVGLGFNQIAVAKDGSVDNRMGLSLFMGKSYESTNGIQFGIYLGVDWVKLESNEEFAGDSKGNQIWLGLVLGTGIGDSK